MTGRPGALALCGVVVVGVVVLSGCTPSGNSAAAAQATGGSPRRLDACLLLTSGEKHQLGVVAGRRGSIGAQFPGSGCVWPTYSQALPGRFLGQVIPTIPRGAGLAESINNLPAGQYWPPGLNPRTSCVWLVELGQGQILWAQYSQDGDRNGMDQDVACNKAQRVASFMASSYPTLPKPGQ